MDSLACRLWKWRKIDFVAEVARWPHDCERAITVAATLVADGLALPDGSGGLKRP